MMEANSDMEMECSMNGYILMVLSDDKPICPSEQEYNKKTTRVPVLSHQTTRVKTYHLSANREGDEFFTEGGLVNENSNEGGFLFIMNLKK